MKKRSYNRGKKCLYCDRLARVKGICMRCYAIEQVKKRHVQLSFTQDGTWTE